MKSNKSQSKMDSLKNNKKLRIFLLFLALSFLFWMLIKLSKEYITDIEFELVYTDVPNNKLIQNEPDDIAILTVKSIGFKLLKYSFKKNALNYSLTEISRRKGSEYFSVTKSNINYLQAQLSAETTVLKIKPDTLYFDLGIKKSKKIKILTNVNFQFKPGFNLVKDFIIEPKFVTISGPEKIIDTINEVYTEAYEMIGVSNSFEKTVKLLLPGKSVSLSVYEISLQGEVDKITEGSFNLPFEVINLPKNYFISTYPKEVKVVYQVALKDYNKITANSFKIQCDYKQTEDNNLEYIIPKIKEKPEILFDVKVIPNKIEFLIKK